MQTKINFGYPKWPPAAILRKLRFHLKWPEMAAGDHFEQKK